MNTSKFINNCAKVNLDPDTWLFDSEQLNKLIFGQNYEHAKKILIDANKLIEEERLFLTKDRRCISCCCLCAFALIIGLPCFIYYACDLQKNQTKNMLSIKEKLKKHISEHRERFNSNNCDLNFHEDKFYISEDNAIEKIVYSIEFIIALNLNFDNLNQQNQNLQQFNYQNQNKGGNNDLQYPGEENRINQDFNSSHQQNVYTNPNQGIATNQGLYQVNSNQ
jgi:hypothetical protein